MISIENIFSFKKFLEKIGTKNYDFREKKFYINPENKMNYLFNSSIKGIEESDLILLIGTNPRHEATLVNARIKKATSQNKTPVYSIGNAGDLTYDYTIVGKETNDLKEIFEGKSDFNKKLSLAKKPLFIIGESALEIKNGIFILEDTKDFLIKNNFINNTWNAFNILSQNASTVGALDLKFYNINEQSNFNFFEKLENKKFELLYLLGSDNLEIKKNNEFIIYQGSHGDRGAEIADVILPSPTYTEQNGLYTNLEGRVQSCRKASYPVGESLEDWKIFNLLTKNLYNVTLFENLEVIRKLIEKEIPHYVEIDKLPNVEILKERKKITSFLNEKIDIKEIDYYFSNSIARSSKTMSDCRNILLEKKNGTNN